MKTLNLARLSTVFSALVLVVAPLAAQELRLSVFPAESGRDGVLSLKAGQDAELIISTPQGGMEVWLQLSIRSENPAADGLLTAVFSGKSDEDGSLSSTFSVPHDLAGRVIEAQAYAMDIDGAILRSNALKVSIRKDDGYGADERNTAWAPPAVERNMRPTPEPPAVERFLVPSKSASPDDVHDGEQAPAVERILVPSKSASPDDIHDGEQAPAVERNQPAPKARNASANDEA